MIRKVKFLKDYYGWYDKPYLKGTVHEIHQWLHNPDYKPDEYVAWVEGQGYPLNALKIGDFVEIVERQVNPLVIIAMAAVAVCLVFVLYRIGRI